MVAVTVFVAACGDSAPTVGSEAFIEKVREPQSMSNTPSYPFYSDAELVALGLQACDLITIAFAQLDSDESIDRTRAIDEISRSDTGTLTERLAWEDIVWIASEHLC